MSVENTAAQTLETKNQPATQKIDNSAEERKASRVMRLKDEFKSAIKSKKADWILTMSKDEPYGISLVTWKLGNKQVQMVAHDYETVEEASRPFHIAVDCQTCSLKIPQKGFGDESYLMSSFYEKEGKMYLTFRSGNYLISLTGTKDDIFSFAKIISDTISEKNKSVQEAPEDK
ncbi:MAG: hypothetical protein M3033_06120 [Acidobacteriota bacterium]|nr:hypothetical protein [Acidobacteriota bacterium]